MFVLQRMWFDAARSSGLVLVVCVAPNPCLMFVVEMLSLFARPIHIQRCIPFPFSLFFPLWLFSFTFIILLGDLVNFVPVNIKTMKVQRGR